MARLEIEQHRSKWMPKIPHKILINGQMIGIMQDDKVNIEMPIGEYVITIQSMLKWFYTHQKVKINNGVRNILTFGDREGLWDSLFWIALVMEIVHLFLTLPTTWNIIYHIVDEGLFVAWIVYEISIRKHYFKTNYAHLIASK